MAKKRRRPTVGLSKDADECLNRLHENFPDKRRDAFISDMLIAIEKQGYIPVYCKKQKRVARLRLIGAEPCQD